MNMFLTPTTTAFAVSLLLLAGCKSAQKETAEFDSILKTVSYDTSVPASSASSPSQTTTSVEPIDTTTTIVERVSSVRETVGDGIRATAGLALFGVFKIVESTLGLDDDEDDHSTPRGKADKNFNQWVDDRDRWRRDR